MFEYWENFIDDQGLYSTIPEHYIYEKEQLEGVDQTKDKIIFRSKNKREVVIWTLGVLNTMEIINKRLQIHGRDYRFKEQTARTTAK